MPVQHVKSKPIIIGLTGGIASGKTTACKYFIRQGFPVIDSDAIVKDLWINQHEMLESIDAVFHTLDKKMIASQIFENSALRETLNAIVHPYVFEKIDEQRNALKDEEMVIIDMPLLFEVGYQDKVDYTALVYARPEQINMRVMMRDYITDEDAAKRMASQMPIDQKKAKADFILDNTHDKDYLYQTIDQMLRSILNEE